MAGGGIGRKVDCGKKPDNISRMAAMGRTLGISYGNMMAKNGGKNMVTPDEPEAREELEVQG